MFLMVARIQAQPCSVCPAQADVIVNCNPALPNDHTIPDEGGLIGLDTDLDSGCDTNVSLTLVPGDSTNRPLKVRLLSPKPSATTFNTELRQMWLVDATSGVQVKAGLDMNAGANATAQPVSNSTGQIVQNGTNNAVADSFFDVFCEVTLPGGTSRGYNQSALRIQGRIDCIPPRAEYIHPQVCLPLYSQPGSGGTLLARLTGARHLVNEGSAPVPTVSQWGLVIMTLALLTAATIIFARRRPAARAA
jgi:hypothetical protein